MSLLLHGVDPTSVGLDEQKWGFLGPKKWPKPDLYNPFFFPGMCHSHITCKDAEVKIAVGSECEKFPACVKLNITGGCCPTPDGVQLGCCAAIWAKLPPANDIFSPGTSALETPWCIWFWKAGSWRFQEEASILIQIYRFWDERVFVVRNREWYVCIGKYIHFMLLWWWLLFSFSYYHPQKRSRPESQRHPF